MTAIHKCIIILFSFICVKTAWTQTSVVTAESMLSFEEYLGYVKKHHPLIKQAELTLSVGEANLLKARGGFDPKIEVDYDRKTFKDTEYYDQLRATFKIPTWYGIEFKAEFEENTGDFINPNLTVPKDGLYAAGVSFSLARGFLINERMASLKKARFFKEQTKADRDLLVNNLLFDASKAYLAWVETTNEQFILETFLENASTRIKAVQRSVDEGDKAAIDITEARITLQNRQLDLEAVVLKRRKAALVASNFLWLDDIPMEIRDNVTPALPEYSILEASLLLDAPSKLLENHPKILSLDAKINGLTIDKRLKNNKLLPKLNLKYNFLSPDIDQVDTFNTTNYKASVDFSLPLFLRKERGDAKLAKLKLQDANFERSSLTLTIRNKITAANAEIESLDIQNELIRTIVKDYKILVKAEERKFLLGESSLFLINSREQKLIDARLKENKLTIKQLSALLKLYNAMGIVEPNQ